MSLGVGMEQVMMQSSSKLRAVIKQILRDFIRVFVSSTFRDMMGERDELMTHAWPELRRFCRERQVELVEVDLRWGIAEEQSTRKETLKLCLDEICACRPFFTGLLSCPAISQSAFRIPKSAIGKRYGWVPGGQHPLQRRRRDG